MNWAFNQGASNSRKALAEPALKKALAGSARLDMKEGAIKGINLAEPIHLSSPIDGNAGDFTPENLERGYTLRNLVTLQSLDVLYKGLVLGEDLATPEATAQS